MKLPRASRDVVSEGLIDFLKHRRMVIGRQTVFRLLGLEGLASENLVQLRVVVVDDPATQLGDECGDLPSGLVEVGVLENGLAQGEIRDGLVFGRALLECVPGHVESRVLVVEEFLRATYRQRTSKCRPPRVVFRTRLDLVCGL